MLAEVPSIHQRPEADRMQQIIASYEFGVVGDPDESLAWQVLKIASSDLDIILLSPHRQKTA